ncbi:MAG: Maf family nucleotide pyrophosphatase [Paramuribaculum sp.]|nr:Maf family nucleotide pyrophosphatase [Paramuribaculum sp.]
MIDWLKDYDIILASGSPRRREILAMTGLPFRVDTSVEVDESYPDTLPVEEVAGYLARKKCDAHARNLPPRTLVIAADTVVIAGGRILGKPADEADARRMLSALAGRTHTVVTGVAVATDTGSASFSTATEVDFAPLSAEEIDYYVANYRPLDKAGSYGIQEWIGAIGVEAIRGSFYNVMGLPVQRLYSMLKQGPLPETV